ncbi:MAG: alpha/beta fold hydrolase, partial [Alphaproteobacteria bacterium]|nr:alpha/beta fold hydrolase [Alphaproteobacteria bacterium]
PFKPRFPWWSADLQTVALVLRPPQTDLAPHASERVCFPMADRTGDILLGMLDRPAEPRRALPLVILIHGITGGEDSPYVVTAARHLLDGGYSVLRLNLRGAGPSRPYCGEHYHAGRSADFRRVLAQLPDELTREGVVAVGYSLGGAMLLKYLGEEGSFTSLRAAASICAPIDLMGVCTHMMRPRNRFYHAYLLNALKAEAMGEGARLTDAECRVISAARSVQEYDDQFIAPRYGFRDVVDYYELCKPIAYMPEVRVPTMVLAACDDPWIPIEHYRAFDWSANPWLLPVLTPQGGHVGFHGYHNKPWSDLALEKFLQRVAEAGR